MRPTTTVDVSATPERVPFFRPDLREEEIREVLDTLRSGWLTTGPRTARFEAEFGLAVGASCAVAVNSCTAALHLAVEALGLKPGQGVLVPTMTFAATAEVVRYLGATPVLVDCDPVTGNMDLADAQRRLERAASQPGAMPIVGIIPVHVGGFMMDVDAIRRVADRHHLWIVEDAAHAFPAAWRPDAGAPWRRCGDRTADVTCFSFYANKTLTTGEGGMAVTADPALASRMRLMALHGLSHDAWGRYTDGGTWDYQIVAPGFKYNLTDVAAAIGIHQLARAEEMRERRESIAGVYRMHLEALDAIELPPAGTDRVHAWHLFPLRLRLELLSGGRNTVIDELKRRGVMCAVHWRPLHLHPYYRETYGLEPADCPNATAMFDRILSLPLFPSMSNWEVQRVCDAVADVIGSLRR